MQKKELAKRRLDEIEELNVHLKGAKQKCEQLRLESLGWKDDFEDSEKDNERLQREKEKLENINAELSDTLNDTRQLLTDTNYEGTQLNKTILNMKLSAQNDQRMADAMKKKEQKHLQKIDKLNKQNNYLK